MASLLKIDGKPSESCDHCGNRLDDAWHRAEDDGTATQCPRIESWTVLHNEDGSVTESVTYYPWQEWHPYCYGDEG